MKGGIKMGWWKIDNIETGGIDWENWDGTVLNVTKDNITNELVNGDGPADIMGDALEQIRKEYKNYWNREPTLNELQAVFNFCMGGISKELHK